MALEGAGRILEPERGKTLIYVSQKVATDSAWPFSVGDEVVVRIDRDSKRVIIEKAKR